MSGVRHGAPSADQPDAAPPPAFLAWAGRAIPVVLLALFARNAWLQVPASGSAPIDHAARLQDLVRDRQPAGRDGWGDLLSALDRFDEIDLPVVDPEIVQLRLERSASLARLDWSAPIDAGLDGVVPDPFDPIFAPERDAVEALASRGILDLLDRLAAAPRFVRPLPDSDASLFDLAIPEVAQARQLARALRLHGRLALLRGDRAEAVRDVERMRALARAIGNQAYLIDSLVGLAIDGVAERLASSILDDPTASPALLRELLAIERRQPLPTDPRAAIAGERLAQRATIDELFTDDGRGDGVLLADAFALFGTGSPGPAPSLAGGLIHGRRETLAALDEHDRLEDENLALAPCDRSPPVGHDLDAWRAALGPRHLILRVLLTAWSGETIEERAAEREAFRLRIALEIVRRERGVLVADPSVLVPDPLSELPTDVHTRTPLRVAERIAADGVRVVVAYSPGPDRVDDGGDPDKDLVLLEVRDER